MSKMPKRVAVIGLDGVPPQILEKHINDGYLPNIRRFLDQGTWCDDCLPPLPTITPPNWATIATGAWPGTHGVTDFHYHIPNTSPTYKNALQNWSRDAIDVETVWESADKADKRVIVMNYPGGWPSRLKNGVVICGKGFTIGEELRNGLPALEARFNMCQDFFVSTEFGPNTARVRLDDAEDWENCSEMGEDPLESSFELPFPDTSTTPAKTVWWVLVRNLGGDGYDTVTLSPTRNFSDAFCTLKLKEWSKKIVASITMQDGTQNRVCFRCKNITLNDDASEMRFLVSALINMDVQWVDPVEYNELLFQGEAVMHSNAGSRLMAFGVLDDDTYVEMNLEHSRWISEVAKAFLEKQDWDLFYLHSHPLDWSHHSLLTDMTTGSDKRKAEAWEMHRRISEAEDQMVGELLQVIGKDALAVLVADHGSTADGVPFNPVLALQEAGLITTVIQEDDQRNAYEKSFNENLDDFFAKLSGGGYKENVDISNSKALVQRMIHAYVNLKGRDPGGIVEPEDYEKVQQQICDALLTYREPTTGERPVVLAVPKQDARWFGLYGDKVGDVIFAVKPQFGSQHGYLLPTGVWEPGRLNSLLAFMGPGVRKNHRITRPCHLVSLVPTICYLGGLPVPDAAEGAILYEALKSPNFYADEIRRLTKSLEAMEAAMSRSSHKPWEKHDCA